MNCQQETIHTYIEYGGMQLCILNRSKLDHNVLHHNNSLQCGNTTYVSIDLCSSKNYIYINTTKNTENLGDFVLVVAI